LPAVLIWFEHNATHSGWVSGAHRNKKRRLCAARAGQAVPDPGARCCDDCNSRVVLPMRLERLRERDKTQREGNNGGALQ